MKPNEYLGKSLKYIKIEEGIYERDKLYILRTEKIPTIIIECGSIAVPQEETIISSDGMQAKLANAINQAVVRYALKSG